MDKSLSSLSSEDCNTQPGITLDKPLKNSIVSSKKSPQRLYFEDLHVGQRFVSDTYTVTESEIIEFASKYDPQAFHIDPEAAKHLFFGGLVASGWHTAAIGMRLLITSGMQLGDGAIGIGGEILWTKPLRPGDTLHLEGEILEVNPSRSHPDRGSIVARMETHNQHNEVIQVFTGKIIVPKQPTQ